VDFLDIGYSPCDYYAMARFPGAFALDYGALDSVSGCVTHPSVLLRLCREYFVVCAIWLSIHAVPCNGKQRSNPMDYSVGIAPFFMYRVVPSFYA